MTGRDQEHEEPCCQPRLGVGLRPRPRPAHGPEAFSAAGVDMTEVLPFCLTAKILLLLPPKAVASSCAFVSPKWSRVCGHQSLWKEFCQSWALTDDDATSVLGGWRGLYAQAFGSNLLHSPCFQSVQRSSNLSPWASPSDNIRGTPDHSPFLSSAAEFLDRLSAGNETDPGFRRVTHWAHDRNVFMSPSAMATSPWGHSTYFRTCVQPARMPSPADACDNASVAESPTGRLATADCSGRGAALSQGGSITDRNARNGQGAIQQRVDAGPGNMLCHGTGGDFIGVRVAYSLESPPEPGSTAVQMSASAWGSLKQCVNLGSFPSRFLDKSPPIQISAWCQRAPDAVDDNPEEIGEVRLQAFLMADLGKAPFAIWDSGDLCCKTTEWHRFKGCLKDYPPGLRAMHLRVSGKGAIISRVFASFESSTLDP